MILSRPHLLRIRVKMRRNRLFGSASAGTQDIVDCISGMAAGSHPAAATSLPKFGRSIPQSLIAFVSFATRAKRARRRARGSLPPQIWVSLLKVAIRSCRPSAWDREISAPFGLKSGCDTASLSVACQSSALGTPFSDIAVRATRSLLRGSLSVFQMYTISMHATFSSPVGCQLSLQWTFSCLPFRLQPHWLS